MLAAAGRGPRTVVEIVPDVYEEPLSTSNASWLLSQTMCYLRHLELMGRVASESDGEAERWRVM